ncbi:MAG: Flp pilus assembly complex ATPase component TadA, partial [Candidatus Portnoybacteria bacterium]|nr:Flp pilus assembly complex ATPase component TadA [Candidatus Portnoybacteria bacterium]
MRIDIEKMRNFMADTGMVTLEQFKELERETGGDPEKLESLLIEKGIVTPVNLLQIKGHIAGIPFISLEKAIIDPEVLKLIPEETARSLRVVAYRRGENALEVAMLDPDNLQTIDFIKKKTGLEVIPRLTNQISLESVLKQYGETLQEEFSQLVGAAMKEANTTSLRIMAEGKGKGEKDLSIKDLQQIAEKLPIIQVVDSLLRHAVVQNASDIHIEPSEQAVVVRYRIDGILRDVMTLPRQVYPALVARVKVLSNLKLDEHRLPQDGRFKIEGEREHVSIRVSIIPIKDGEKVVMRLLREEVAGLTLESLGLEGIALESIRLNLKIPNGLILVTGPTGSGKTTTLYALMDILNTPGVNIA